MMRSTLVLLGVFMAGGVAGFVLGHLLICLRRALERRRAGPLPPRRLPL